MFKTLELSDQTRRTFLTHKNFSWNNDDSGSSIFSIKTRSGSTWNYVSSSDVITTITTGSISTNYFATPSWNFINTRYYNFFDLSGKNISYQAAAQTTTNPNHQSRSLFKSASIFNIEKDVIGDRIKPGSVKLSDTSNGQTFDIRDDGDGNLYDFAHSASFAAHKSSSFNMSQGINSDGSGSVIGNVFYSDGLLVVNQAGSYKDVGFGTDWTISYQSTHYANEYEYILRAPAGEFNMSSNQSITKAKSASIELNFSSLASATDIEKDYLYSNFPPSDNPSGQGTGSYSTTYQAASHSIDNITGSDWYPYVTQIGLYDVYGDLVAVAKPGQPVKLNQTLDTTFVVRFDK